MIVSSVSAVLSVGLRLILTTDPAGYPTASVFTGQDITGSDSFVGVVSTPAGLEPSHTVSNMSHYSSAIGGPGVSTPFYFLLTVDSHCVTGWSSDPPSAKSARVGEFYVGRHDNMDGTYVTGKIVAELQLLYYYSGTGGVGTSDKFETLTVDCMDQEWFSPGITLQVALQGADAVPDNAIAVSPGVYVGAARCFTASRPDVHLGPAALIGNASYFACLDRSFSDSTKVFATLDHGYFVAWLPYRKGDPFPQNAALFGSNLLGWKFYAGRAFAEDWDSVMVGVVENFIEIAFLAIPFKTGSGSTRYDDFEVMVIFQ